MIRMGGDTALFGKTANGPQRPSEATPVPALPTSSAMPAVSNSHLSESSTQSKRLTVGPGISLAGEITDCDRLVVQGDARVRLHRVRTIEIAQTGRFTEGRAEVEEADIAGLYEGELTVSGRLLVRSTGRVTGSVRYGELEVERGGHLLGMVEVQEPTRGLGSDQMSGPIDSGGRTAQTAPTAEGSSATVANLRPPSKPGPKRGQGRSVGDGTDQGQLAESG
jgi:cytoskeletal protein CcmA (bactofilin family)